MIAVIIPTIAGREALLERTVDAYREHSTEAVALLIVRDRPTIGQAWADGVASLPAGADHVHLSADDVAPHPGWDAAAIAAVERGHYPSPRILNADGSLHSCGTMGGGMLLPECADGTPCAASPFPFVRRSDLEHLGPILAAHYYCDDHLGWRARMIGLEPVVCRGYLLTHLEGTAGRPAMVARAADDRARFLTAIGMESPAEVATCA